MAPSLLLAALLAARAPAPGGELFHDDVRYESGELELAAELLLRDDVEGPRAAVVVLQGSGDSDRSNGWSRAIAEVLAGQGLVTLLTDKRGCGGSGGDWRLVGFDALAADALAGVRFLTTLPDVDPARVGLCGLSQGGWVAPVAAASSPDVAFVIDVSGAAVGYAEQVTLELANTARQAGLDEAGVREVLALNRAAMRYVAGGPWKAYAEVRSRGLAGPARPVIEGFPRTPDEPRWEFARRVATFDPMPYWTAVDQPVLVLYGEEDERDNVPVAESVRRLEHAFRLTCKTNARIVVVPGAGHAFLTKEHELEPAFVETVDAWLRDTGLASRVPPPRATEGPEGEPGGHDR